MDICEVNYDRTRVLRRAELIKKFVQSNEQNLIKKQNIVRSAGHRRSRHRHYTNCNRINQLLSFWSSFSFYLFCC